MKIKNMSFEETEKLSKELGEQIKLITEKTAKRINKLLNKYQMQAKFECVVQEKPPTEKNTQSSL